MSNISAVDQGFIPADILYSEVKRILKSYVAANLVDEGEFPVYAKHIIDMLKLGVYTENRAVVKIENNRGCLPSNYRSLYSAYKCTPSVEVVNKGNKSHLQSSSTSFNIDITDSIIIDNCDCEVSCCSENSRVIESISIKNCVQEGTNVSFSCFVPLRLSPNVYPSDCQDDCMNKFNTSALEISIRDNILYANFTDDCVYIQYYGFPIDENGDLLILDSEPLKKAIVWYIVYQILLTFWFDSSVPDLQGKWQKAEMEYNRWFAEAKYERKLPYFSEIINSARTKRSQELLAFMTAQYSNTNYQRTTY